MTANLPGTALILVADDNEAARYTKSRMLRAAGFNVVEASTGAQTLAAARTQLPDLVLLDVKMPDIDGYEVCHRLRADPATASLAIVQISASFQEPEDRVRGLEGGADTFLLAPAEPEELIATVRAMLRLRRAESAARVNEIRLRALLDNTAALTYAIDADGRYLFVNRRFEEVFQRDHGDTVGRHVSEVLPPQLAGNITASSRQALIAAAPIEVEEVLPGEHGPRTYTSVKGPLRDVSGVPTGVVSVSIDITERKQLEARLQETIDKLNEADRRKDEFLATLAHELRNPLAPIRHAVRIAGMPNVSEAQRNWAHEVIDRQSRQMARLLDDLLEVSRISRGKIALRKERTDLIAALKTALETARPLVEAKQHEVQVSFPPEPILLDADPVRLAQIFANLITNAAKYTPPQGHITLSIARGENFVSVAVRDTGIGLDAQTLPRIFEMFSQAHPTHGRDEDGLGIGLALVRGLVDLHEGMVQAHSEGLGKGCEFTVTLPIDTPRASAGT